MPTPDPQSNFYLFSCKKRTTQGLEVAGVMYDGYTIRAEAGQMSIPYLSEHSMCLRLHPKKKSQLARMKKHN
jgi:hypothetical protein